ncbi:MAG: hemin-degrading factor [Flavobacteriales bacterium]|nr:MAG: hemin-degrading factor [Flavobacteriales bacterium]
MLTTSNLKSLVTDYNQLKEQNPQLRFREAAQSLGVSEAELLFHTGQGTLLEITPSECIKAFKTLGRVMSLTRNEACVLEHKGEFEEVEISGPVATVIGAIETRAFFHGWNHIFAVEQPKGTGIMRSIQVFDRFGDAVTKVIILNPHSDQVFAEIKAKASLVNDFSVDPIVESAKTTSKVDRLDFIKAWKEIRDPHDFFGMLKNFGVDRYSAMQIAEGECTFPFPTEKIPDLLYQLSERAMPVMIFAGNRGNIQIHQDKIQKIVPLHQEDGKFWINVMDPDFNLHLRMDLLAKSWVVYKPSPDGPVWSIEAYDVNDEIAVQFFGLRKPGIPQPAEWKELIDSLCR